MSPDQFTPPDSNIPERAAALAKAWTPMFAEDAPNRRWLHYGSQKLFYVPADDEIYRPNIHHWMYGLKAQKESEGGDLNELF
ncbi:hypothetical protein P691DRAFT_812049 [Macrolepiota fuliginosa MF-IS2]|uniref:Uncharacterized protein n=1 Tax=Macrolepiota fuliginosa MF-IS2 TaxID=1400762 RepID=A0A9P5XEQ4_9AGAR|nr:hypothetical protein P691DRAFT_812049 [Macrolepiota fuliginosa MF-IS2]